MVKAIRMSLLLIGFLPHTIAFADDAYSLDPSDDSSLQRIDIVQTSMPDASMPHASMLHGISDMRISFSALDTLEFHDSSTIGRARKIRSLSLLTLAEFKRSRLYLGVNERGFFGLHFNAAKQNDDRCLEVARMPYLQKHSAE